MRGADLVARHLGDLGSKALDVRPAQPAVARRVAIGYARAFSRSGPGWAPIKASTIRRRIADGYSGTAPLVASGRYKRAASAPTVKATGDGFVISVSHEAVGFNQAGTKHSVARPLRLSFGDRTALVKEISDHIFSAYG